MDAQRLQGPKGRFGNGEIAAISFFERCKVVKQRLGWRWVARNAQNQVLAVYQVEDWSDSGDDGALWQLRELADSVLHNPKVYRGQ